NNNCPDGERRLPVRNLGSSGQDGVEIDLGSENGTLSDDVARGNTVIMLDGTASSRTTTELRKRGPEGPFGHVTLIKFTDDIDPAAGRLTTTVDPTGLGVSQCDLFLLDASGHLLGHTVVDPTVPIVQTVSAERKSGLKKTESEIEWSVDVPTTVSVPGM